MSGGWVGGWLSVFLENKDNSDLQLSFSLVLGLSLAKKNKLGLSCAKRGSWDCIRVTAHCWIRLGLVGKLRLLIKIRLYSRKWLKMSYWLKTEWTSQWSIEVSDWPENYPAKFQSIQMRNGWVVMGGLDLVKIKTIQNWKILIQNWKFYFKIEKF